MTDRPFRIIVPGQPIAQPRHRSRIVWPSNVVLRSLRSVEALRKMLRTQQYVPADHPVHAFRDAVAMIARQAWRGDPFAKGVPLRLDLQLVFDRPKYMTRKTKPNPRQWHAVKPDNDNVIKAVKDAMTGIVYHDDNQIAVEQIAKFYAAGGEQPHTEIRLRELT